jgi:hypothetical protein
VNYVFLPVYFGKICYEERRNVEVTMITIDYKEVSLHTASQIKYSHLLSLAHLLTLGQQLDAPVTVKTLGLDSGHFRHMSRLQSKSRKIKYENKRIKYKKGLKYKLIVTWNRCS